MNGFLKAQFDGNNKLDVLDLITFNHSEYVPRSGLLQATAVAAVAAVAPDIKQSPSTSKTQGKRGSQQRQKQQIQAPQDQSPKDQRPKDQRPKVAVPESLINDHGTTQAVSQFLEVMRAAI